MEGAVLLGVSCISGFALSTIVASALCKGVVRSYAAATAHGVIAADVRTDGLHAKAALLARYYVRNGVPSFSTVAGIMAGWSFACRMAGDAAGLLRRRGWDATSESVLSLAAAACCAVFLVAAIAFKTLIAAICLPACSAAVASIVVVRGRAKEKELLRDQVPDALRCMEACLHAGLSLPQAFAETAREAKQPLKESFMQVTRDIDLGFSMREALERFHRNAGLEELGFVAVALDIQYACGGSATPILHAAEDSIARGLDLRRSLRVQTAQARFSAQMVSVLPVFLLAILSMVSPGFLDPFFSSGEGLAMLAAAFCMQMLGVVLIRRMLSIEV